MSERIVVIGGSGASTPEFADALATGYPMNAPHLEVVLQGRSDEKLRAVVAGFTTRLNGHPAVHVTSTTDLDAALTDATIVINQVRIGGLGARAFDERYPQAFGVFGEETMGPGGFANALRTVPALASTWASIAERAPGALVINLTNPSGVVVGSVARSHPALNVVSVCDAPVTFLKAIAKSDAQAPGAAQYVGLNHAGFWIPPAGAANATYASALSGITLTDADALGAIPTPYLRFYLHPAEQFAAQQKSTETRAEALMRLEPTLLAEASEGRGVDGATLRGAVWYSAVIVPLIAAHLNVAAAPNLVLGLPNLGVADWLPIGVVVEGVATHTAHGWTHVTLPTPPSGARGELVRVAAYESALIEALAPAARTGSLADASRSALVDALMQNPAVGTAELAESLYGAIEARADA
jgi:6-phospho-beta-glucosidase